MEGSNYGIVSLIPVILTIIIAIKYKKIILALLVGSFSGVLIFQKGNLYKTIVSFFADYMVPTMADPWNAKILLLMVILTAWVKLLEVSGGTHAFARSTVKKVNTKPKAQIAAWIGGLLVFFTDFGSPLIVGPIFRPLFDELKISREKLAWIADSTASPWSILVPFLGWAAYIMGLMAQELPGQEMFPLLIQSQRFNFYAILSILFVPFVIFTGRDLKRMAIAEKRASKGIIHAEDINVSKVVEIDDVAIKNSSVWVMVIPLIVFIATLFIFQPLGFPFAKGSASGIEMTLILSATFASIASIILMKKHKIKDWNEGVAVFNEGVRESVDIIVLLILAWMLGGVTKALGAPDFIISVAIGRLPIWAMPVVIFLTGALISFSTGSSWGTFSIMMPFAIPLALELDSSILPVAIAAVLSGGLFGDHCSPISDTTILSGTGSGCDLVAHVRTQMPYAMFVAVTSIIAFIVAAITKSAIILPLALVVMYVAFMLISKKDVDTNEEKGAEV